MNANQRRLTTIVSVVSLLLLSILILATYNQTVKLYTVKFYQNDELITSISKEKNHPIDEKDLANLDNIIASLDSSYIYNWSTSKSKLVEVDLTKLNDDTKIYLYKELKFTPLEVIPTSEIKYEIEYVYEHNGKDPYAILTIEPEKDVNEYKVVVYVNNNVINPVGTNTYIVNYQTTNIKVEIAYQEKVEMFIDDTSISYGDKLDILYHFNKDNIIIMPDEIAFSYYLDKDCLILVEPVEKGLYYVKANYHGNTYAIDEAKGKLTITDGLPIIEEVPTAEVGYEETTLNNITLKGGKANVDGKFVWVNKDTYLSAGTKTYQAYFIPNDDHYQTIICDIMVKAYSFEETLQQIKEERIMILNEYRNLLTSTIHELPILMIDGKYKDTNIIWLVDSTIISINEVGRASELNAPGDYPVNMTAIITIHDVAEYVNFSFIYHIDEINNVVIKKHETTPLLMRFANKNNIKTVLERLNNNQENITNTYSVVVNDDLFNYKEESNIIKVDLLEKQDHLYEYVAKCQRIRLISEVILWKIISNEDKNNNMQLINSIKINKYSLEGEIK